MSAQGHQLWLSLSSALALWGLCSPAAAQPRAQPEDLPALQVGVAGGGGIGARTLLWPSSGETRSVDTRTFATVDLATRIYVAVTSAVALGLELSYQTSVAAQVEEAHIAGQSETIGIRANHLTGVFALALGSSGFRVTPALGFVTWGLRPEVHHLLTPSYSLVGPLARVGVRIPCTRALSLHLAPEVQYLFVGVALVQLDVAARGFAFGGEVMLQLAVASQVSLELSGRVARAWMTTSSGATATDTARFATLRLVWQP